MIIGKRIVSVTNADTDYISVSEAKQHLRVTSSADDAYISSLIGAALDMASHYVGYEVRESVCRYGFGELVGQPATVNPLNGAPLLMGNYCRIPARVISLDEFYYVNQNNELVSFSDYITEPEPLSNFGLDLYLTSTAPNSTDAQTKYVAEVTEGFTPSEFSESMKMACLLMVAQYYDNRQNIIVGTIVDEMPYGSDFLLNKFKLSTFA